jgi:hypothetical protein
MLKGFRQNDGTELIELLLATGLLRQQEVNKNRPTVSVSPQLVDTKLRAELLSGVSIPARLEAKLAASLRLSRPLSAIPATSVEKPAIAGERAGMTVGSNPVGLPPSPHIAPAGGPNRGGDSTAPSSGAEYSGAEYSGAAYSGVGRSGAERTDGATAGDLLAVGRGKPDWQWTLGLFKAGHVWDEVASLRRMSDQELAVSLSEAVRAGAPVERAWLASDSQKPRTAGQQQVVQEIRRQAAAWSG